MVRNNGGSGLARLDLYRHRAVDLGHDLQAGEMRHGQFFHPDRLPDSRDGRVPNPAGFEYLLAVKLVCAVCVGGVGHAHGQRVLAGLHRIGHVERERQIAARMAADFDSVDPDGRLVINRFEVQSIAFSGLLLDLHRALIPQGVLRRDPTLDAGERRLDRKRHQDLAIPLLRSRVGVRAGHGVVPVAVQIGPLLAHHRRTRILLPGVFRRHILSPRRAHRDLAVRVRRRPVGA
jgi:hypothetical protein